MHDSLRHETEHERPGGPARTPIPDARIVADGTRPEASKRFLRSIIGFLPTVAYGCLRVIEIAVTAVVILALFAFFILGFVCTVR